MLREEQQDSFGKSTGKGIMDDKAFKSNKSECNQWEIIFEVLWPTSIIFRAEAYKYNLRLWLFVKFCTTEVSIGHFQTLAVEFTEI
jgi:hypothetical protein